MGAQYNEIGQEVMKQNTLAQGLVQYVKDPLRKNSAFLIATHFMIGILGFFFWAIAARLYTAEQVGLGTALISAVLLLHTLSRLGFDIGMVRFLPSEEDKPGMINTYFTLVGLFSVVLALVFVLGVEVWSPALAFVREDGTYFVIFILFAAAVSLIGLLRQGVFVAFRSTQFSFAMEVVAALRLPLVAALMTLGTLGIFLSWGVASVAALLVGVVLILRLEPGYRFKPEIRRQTLSTTLRFSLGNYAAESLRELPGFLLPLLVVNILEPEMGAYFYVAWTVASVILMIAYATSFSLLAEVSREPARFKSDVIRAMKFMLLLLIPAAVVVFFLGDKILALFGAEYAENGFDLLRLLTLSGIPLAFNILYITWKRLRQEIRAVVYVYGFVAAFTIGVGYVLMEEMGLEGIGVAWLSANVMVTVFIGLAMLKRWIQSGSTRDGQGKAERSI